MLASREKATSAVGGIGRSVPGVESDTLGCVGMIGAVMMLSAGTREPVDGRKAIKGCVGTCCVDAHAFRKEFVNRSISGQSQVVRRESIRKEERVAGMR